MRLRDVLVLRVAEVTEEEEEVLRSFGEQLTEAVHIPIILLQEGMSLESISEADMRQAGWVRASSHAQVVGVSAPASVPASSPTSQEA